MCWIVKHLKHTGSTHVTLKIPTVESQNHSPTCLGTSCNRGSIAVKSHKDLQSPARSIDSIQCETKFYKVVGCLWRDMFNHWEGIALQILNKYALLIFSSMSFQPCPRKDLNHGSKVLTFCGALGSTMGAVILQKRMDRDFRCHHETPPPLAAIILTWVKTMSFAPSPSHHNF